MFERIFSLYDRTELLYAKFLEDIKEKKVRNDGTNELLSSIDNCVFNDEAQQF